MAKRCILLFPYKQPLVCMGLEEAISWRSVVHCCKGCLSCFPLCPRLSANECPRRSVVIICKGCSSCFSLCPRIVDRRCPREALFVIVKVVQVVFLYVHVLSTGNIPREALFIVIKVIQVVFLYVHVESLHVPDEPDKWSETVSEDRGSELFLPATRFFQKFYVSLHP